MESEWWVDTGCRRTWKTHGEAEAAGPGSFHNAHGRKPKFKDTWDLLTLSVVFFPPDHNF